MSTESADAASPSPDLISNRSNAEHHFDAESKKLVELICFTLGVVATMASELKQRTSQEAPLRPTEERSEPPHPPARESTEGPSTSVGSNSTFPDHASLQRFCREHQTAFNRVLYVEEYENNNGHQSFMLGYMKMWNDQGLPMAKQLRHLECIIDFLNACKTTPMPMPGFYTWLQKTNRPCPEQWPREDGQPTAYLWQVIGLALTFSGRIKYNDTDTVHSIVQGLFPAPSAARSPPASFEVSFQDLLSVKLDLRPTRLLHEHLLVQGNTVKSPGQALDLDTVGDEILASWAALLGDRTIEPEMRARGLLAEDKSSLIEGVLMLKALDNIRPHHFADREAALRRLVAQRRRWWSVLMRDVRDQREGQPFMFYGAILAVFFGVCTVIQTVTAVWGLVLAAQA
ncbi:hypothetical protein BV25DRAFT_1918360 [Artomyces pyxidatus]|uniref:Uncharacterized protein n=1 Tax=Artomyces pyxidatus TaxID=48021 RepID=A0ACB8SSU5_9AGAM|nr:hypothetical protein BV25DRAFT_1918360 [Artomyces pyxidatus]